MQAARFAGPSKADFLDQLEPDNRGVSVLEALEAIPRFVRRNTRTATHITGETLRRQDLTEYSAVALREVLVNALAHADYSRRGMFIRLAIFSDRLEVENPGGWPLGFSEEDFRAGVSRARNPVIASVLHRLDVMEGWGTGFERIERDAQQLDYQLPLWLDKSTVMRTRLLPHPSLQLPAPPVAPPQSVANKASMPTEQLNERQLWFLRQLARGINVRPASINEQFNVTERTAKRDIAALQDAERVVFIGSTKTGRYRLLSREEQLD